MAKKNLDIRSHVLVPKHRILSEDEVKALLERYNISKIQLPEIHMKDTVVASIKGKEGDVVEISRKGPIESEMFYRKVVK